MKHSVEEIKLKNGARGLLIDVPYASVMCYHMHFRAGIRYAKKPELYEIAHVVEHLSFGANAKYHDEQAYEADFTKNGAYHNAWTSDFSVCYETECADFEWDRILDLKRVALTQPRFNEEELKSEKGNVKTELTGYMNDYTRLLWPKLQQSIGENVPDLQTRLRTIANIELKDIREHYRRTHTAENLRFIIAGKLRHRKRRIIRMLEDWQFATGERFAIPEDDLQPAPPVLIRRKDASNITFGFAWVTRRKLSPAEFIAMQCLCHILTGTMNSRIFGQARRMGLVYSINSTASLSAHDTSWDFDGEVNAENALDLFTLIQKELTKILNGHLSETDLESAKSYAHGRFQMSAQTVGQICDYYADRYFLDETIEDYYRYPQLINSLTASQIIDLAREFAGSGIFSLVAVSSVEKALINQLSEKLKLC